MHIRKVNDSAVRKHKEGMMNTAVIGFPRVGKLRELKFASEKFFHQEISEEELLAVAAELRKNTGDLKKRRGSTISLPMIFLFMMECWIRQ